MGFQKGMALKHFFFNYSSVLLSQAHQLFWSPFLSAWLALSIYLIRGVHLYV